MAGWQLVSPALPLGVLGGLVAWLIGVAVALAGLLLGPRRVIGSGAGGAASWVYRRRWAAAMDTVGLTKERHGTDYVPPLLSVRCNRWMDKLTVRMLPGQRMQDFVDLADRLAHTFGAVDCRVRTTPQPAQGAAVAARPRPARTRWSTPFPPADNLADGLPVARV